MKLCIAEKPSVAKDIAEVIGASSRKDGYYEGNGYCVSWTFGHLCTLKEPADYTEKWKWWNINTLPMLPSKFGIKLIDNQGVKKQFSVLEKLIKDCDEVINCGDAGQEGELIQRWVLAKAKSKKPLKRLWISSLTEEAIKEGFDKLQDGNKYDNLYAAGAARAIGDWLLGMNATRAFTLKYGKDKQVLSVGRVQTPTLALIVERQLQIENFVSEPFFELRTNYRDVWFNSTKGRFKTNEEGEKIIEAINEKEFEIIDYTQKEGKELPPRLFDLTSLQVEVNKKLGLSAEETLNIAQTLYERKIITYPRVDTTFLPDDVYPKVQGILKQMTYYSRFTEVLLGKKIRKSKKVFDNKKVTDHHAIIPTGVTPGGVSPNHQKVYDMIAKRFISVFYPDCKVSNTSVTGKVEKYSFKATGKQILDPGWRFVYQEEGTSSKDEDVMPVFEKGERGPHKPELQEKKTTPPAYFTEATLLRAMETAGKQVDDDELRDLMKENGIGRPSTRANIIETLFKRNYIKKEKKRIVATETGIALVEQINDEILKSAELTGMWEKKLRDIERGSYQFEQFKDELIEMVAKVVHDVKYPPKQPDLPKCPSCGKELIAGKQAWGCSGWKEGCKFVVPYYFKGNKLTLEELTELVEDKKTTKKFLNPFSKKEISLILDDNNNIQFQEK